MADGTLACYGFIAMAGAWLVGLLCLAISAGAWVVGLLWLAISRGVHGHAWLVGLLWLAISHGVHEQSDCKNPKRSAHPQPATQSPMGGVVEWMPMSSDTQS
eukprot:g71642.t1